MAVSIRPARAGPEKKTVTRRAVKVPDRRMDLGNILRGQIQAVVLLGFKACRLPRKVCRQLLRPLPDVSEAPLLAAPGLTPLERAARQR